MNTCESCKHWDRKPFSSVPGIEHKNHRVCLAMWGDFPNMARAEATDDHVITGPKFGCVHHEIAP